MAIRFTQFLMPDGRPVPTDIELDAMLEAKAHALQGAGYKFEIEMLRTPGGAIGNLAKKLAGVEGGGPMPNVSMEIMKPGADGEALVSRLAVNGPDVVVKVTEMITEAHELVFGSEEGSHEGEDDGGDGHRLDADQTVDDTAEGESEGRSGTRRIDQGSGSNPADPSP